jgi:excisionase family DNA binding protein
MGIEVRQKLMTTEEVAEYLGMPVGTLYRWSCQSSGPTPIKVGRHLRYRPADVEKWLTGHEVRR